MLATTAYAFYPEWSIGPAVLFGLTSVAISLLLLLRSPTRNATGYSAFVGALFGFLYNIIIMGSFLKGPKLLVSSVAPASYVFYGIHIAFVFIPGLTGFYRISKESGNKTGRFLVYFGYLWAFITSVVGLALTIYSATKLKSVNAYSGRGQLYSVLSQFANLVQFIYYSPWAFVATYLILAFTSTGTLSKKARNTLAAYTLLIVIVVLVNTILANVDLGSSNIHQMLSTLYAVLFVFTDTPFAIALIIATFYGDLWRYEVKAHSVNSGTEVLETAEGVA